MKPTQLQAQVSTRQAAAYKDTLIRLMQRTGDNIELVNALRDFLVVVDQKSWRGQSDQPMTPGYTERLTQFFRQQAEALKALV